MRTRLECGRGFLAIAAVGATALSLNLVGASLTPASASPFGDPYEQYRRRTSVELPLTKRDFQTTHPDFRGVGAAGGKARYASIPLDSLDSSGKPVFKSTGFKVVSDWKDSAGRPIIAPRSYISAAPGDVPGSLGTTPGGALTSAASFAQWFRTIAGVNTETATSTTLNWDGSAYVFNGTHDSFGSRNDFSYTAAIDTTFIHDADANWYITTGTNAEAFVYIDGKLVIDGGGGLGIVSTEPGLPGGHFDVDVYNARTDKERYHKHEYDDAFDVRWVDVVNDSRLLFNQLVPANYPNPLRVRFFNKDNGGWGTFQFAAGPVQDSGYVRDGIDRVFTRSQLTQLRVDFRTLALMSHTSPGRSQRDVANRDGAFNIKIEDTVTGALVYELAVYHHGGPPSNYQQWLQAYLNNDESILNTPGMGTGTAGMPAMTQRIDLSRLSFLQDGTTRNLKIFFVNRTGAASNFRFETNINTLGLVALPPPPPSID